MRFDHESRGAAPLYAGRHRKGRLAAFGDWRRYRPRTRPGQDAAAAPLTLHISDAPAANASPRIVRRAMNMPQHIGAAITRA